MVSRSLPGPGKYRPMRMVKNTVKLPAQRLHRGEELTAFVFALPIVIGILAFAVYPIAFSLYASFTRWNLLTPPVWIGFDNYVHLFTADPTFPQTLRNTSVFALCTVFIGVFLSLLMALLALLALTAVTIGERSHCRPAH